MVGKGYRVVVLPTTSSRRPDDKAETSRRLTLVLGKTKQSPRENKKGYFKKRHHLISNQMVTETQGNEPRYGTRTKKRNRHLYPELRAEVSVFFHRITTGNSYGQDICL